MTIFKKATINTIYQLVGKAVSLFLGLYITAFISQSISVQDYGRYVLVVSLVIQIAAISEWGTGFIAVRASSQSLYSKADLFFNLLLSRLVLSSLGMVILLILSIFNTFNIPSSALAIASLIIIPLGIKNVVNSYFQSITNFRITALIEILSNVLYALLLFAYSRHNINLNFPITALAISTLLASLTGFVLLLRNQSLNRQIKPHIIKYLFLNAIPVGGQLLIFNIYNRLDLYLLQHFHNEVAVARYGLAYKLYENSILIAAYFMNSLFPAISSANLSSLQHLYHRSLKILISLGITISIILFFLAPLAINIINPEYSDSIWPLRILSLGLAFTYLNHATGYTLTAINKQHYLFGIAIIGLLVNILLNIFLIPLYSYHAAAFTTIITEATICIISLIILKKYFRNTNLSN